MDKEILKEPGYVEELLEIIRSDLSKDELLDRLDDYHDNDIAGALEQLSREERQKLYPILGMSRVAEIFVFIEDPEVYLQDFPWRTRHD